MGDIYLGSDSYLFHDRHIPLREFETYGRGRITALPSETLCAVLGARPGVVSTGDAFTTNAEELLFFEREMVVAKEMEAAAIARVARDLGVPFLAVKAVTDLVDHPEEQSSEMFQRNLRRVTQELAERLICLVEWLGDGRRIADFD